MKVKTGWKIDTESTFKDIKQMLVIHGELEDLKQIEELLN